MYQENVRTWHIYLSEDDEEAPVIDADPEPQPAPPPPINPLGIAYCAGMGAFCTLVPLLAFLLASLLPAYDATFSHTLTLTLALHPSAAQVPLAALSPISRTSQATVPATGSVQEPATKALGLLTFYNGSFSPQYVPAGTRFTGTDGKRVVTAQSVTIPPATATTPPTDGTVSVTAYSTVAGEAGNLAPFDIHQVCCGGAILVQNLNAFSGGQDAHTVTVVTQRDLTTATAQLRNRLEQEANDQAQRELAPGQRLLPLACTTRTTANHQPGDQATQVQITVSERCTPFAYALASIQRQATATIRPRLPRPFSIERVSVIVLTATVTNPTRGTAAVTIHVTAFLRAIRPNRSRRAF
jgi:hypothetical protein